MTAIDNRTLHEGVNRFRGGLVLIYDHENEIG